MKPGSLNRPPCQGVGAPAGRGGSSWAMVCDAAGAANLGDQKGFPEYLCAYWARKQQRYLKGKSSSLF